VYLLVFDGYIKEMQIQEAKFNSGVKGLIVQLTELRSYLGIIHTDKDECIFVKL
jgi:hypothetical protein